MRQLIFKDFYTQNWVIPFIGAVWFVIFTNFFTSGEPIRHVMLLAFLLAWLAIYSNGNTKSFEKESALLISLPIARTEIVFAKYIASFIWFAIAFVVVLVYVFLFNTFAPFPSRMMSVDEMVIAASFFVILMSVFYPILFQVGYQVATIVLLVSTACAFMIVQISINMLENPNLVGFHQFVESVISLKYVVVVSLASISIVFLIASYFLSVRCFSKRDL